MASLLLAFFAVPASVAAGWTPSSGAGHAGGFGGSGSAGAVGGFGHVPLRVRAGPGLLAPRRPSCVLRASTEAQREQGLMGRHGLAPYAGMLFEAGPAGTAAFYMYATPMPLTVAWFDGLGRFLGRADMAPCRTVAASCPHFDAPAPYSRALEVPLGQLSALGVGPGSVLTTSTGAC